ncbi:MAG: lipopolysaccharide assembly protein LapA domain-containing protein [Pseudomonadota bacterium]
MLKKLFARLIWVPIGLLLVIFLVANRHPVAVSLDPFSTDNPAIATPAFPMWVWMILMLMVGFFLGAMTSWFGARGKRKQARADHREVQKLRRENETLSAAAPAQDGAESGDNLPILKAS